MFHKRKGEYEVPHPDEETPQGNGIEEEPPHEEHKPDDDKPAEKKEKHSKNPLKIFSRKKGDGVDKDSSLESENGPESKSDNVEETEPVKLFSKPKTETKEIQVSRPHVHLEQKVLQIVERDLDDEPQPVQTTENGVTAV